ncbi:MAG TPA: NAD(P)-dependent oxidoreductase [Gemmatimonadales bacterium]|nr:NAD(P)-dependent oxidoreductase [Gemmatimonadales bacterium]
MRITFLGLGAIGTPMAAHLAARHDLTVWNRTAERATRFAASHRARTATTPREAVQRAEVVITCLSTSSDVASLLDGADGILAGLGKGVLFIDCTSGDPETSRRIAARLAPLGVDYIDAPVSGGVSGAESASLAVMVGGSAEAFARARPILECFGKRVEHIGPTGAGDALKAVNNALLAVNILASGEGLAALVKAGVPAAKALEIINASSGRSFVTETLVPSRVLNGSWPRTFRLALLDKDVAIAVELLAQTGVAGPVLRLAGERFHAARQRLDAEADYMEAIRLIEQDAGTEIRE